MPTSREISRSPPSSNPEVLTGSNWGPQLPPTPRSRGHCQGNAWRCLLVTTESKVPLAQVEARDAAKHATVHRTTPTTKNYPAPSVPSAGAETLCCDPWKEDTHWAKGSAVFSHVPHFLGFFLSWFFQHL